MVFFRLIISFILILSTGCGYFQSWEQNHPVDHLLPDESLIDNRIDIHENNQSKIPVLFQLDNLEYVTSIGNVDDITNEFFQSTKVRIDQNNRVYILQKHTNSIRIYSKKGEYISSIGKGGQGPGDFNRAIAFDFNQNENKLYVLDEFGYKIEVFEKIDDFFQYLETIFHPFFRAFDICISDQIHISGYTYFKDASDKKSINEKPIMSIASKDYGNQSSYGFIYNSISGISNYHLIMSEYFLACNFESEIITAVSRYFPYLIGYSKNTEQKWVSLIEGYISTTFTESKNNKQPVPILIPHNNLKIYNYKYPIQKINSGKYTLLQFGWADPQPDPKADYTITRNTVQPRFRTVLIEKDTGKMIHSDRYPLIAAWRDNLVVTYDIVEPYQIIFHLYNIISDETQ